MALNLEYQATLGGSFVAVNLTTTRVGPFRLRISDSHPAALDFDVVAAQHTFPIGLRNYIRFWDDAGTTPDGNPQTSSNPLFEGFVTECQPAESNLVRYTAYDPSALSGKEIPVMSVEWDPPGSASVAPLPGTGAVPRLIMNATIDNDVDYAFSRIDNAEVCTMIATVLNDAYQPLKYYQAGPSGAPAYVAADIDQFTYQPQEKIVATNETIRSFVDRLTQQHYPEYAFMWYPGSRKWRWYSRLSATQVTLTLNDPDATNTVLTMELHRSLEGRFPAVKFFGPETTETDTFSTLDGSLTIIDAGTTLETAVDAGGSFDVIAYSQFQITDEDKRRGAKRFPATYLVRENDYFVVGTQSPSFEITFDSGATWQALESVWFDFQLGIATIPTGCYPYFYADPPLQPGNTQKFWTPNGYRMHWAYYVDPITVRRPATGFVGTINTVAGSTGEKKIYDEMLAVGYSRAGTPVTTASRVAQFEALGDAILAAIKDIIYTGGCTLDGLKYDFCRLNRRINIAAVDHNGAAVTTGWEDINAILTDVEYNFAEQTTTLTFSQEALQQWGDNIDLLKTRLRMGYVEKIRDIQIGYTWGDFKSVYSNRGPGYKAWTGVVYTDRDLFYDANLGTIEEAL